MSPPLLVLDGAPPSELKSDCEFKIGSPLPVDGAVRNLTDNWMGVSPILRSFLG